MTFTIWCGSLWEAFLLIWSKGKSSVSSEGRVLVNQAWCKSYLDFTQQTRRALTFIEMDVVLLILSSGGSWTYVPQRSNFLSGTIPTWPLGLKSRSDWSRTLAILRNRASQGFCQWKGRSLGCHCWGRVEISQVDKNKGCSITRAVLRQAPFLILDDAISALDTITESKLLKAIRENLPKHWSHLDLNETRVCYWPDSPLRKRRAPSYRQARGLDEI